MAMGKKSGSGGQEQLWVAGSDLPRGAGHPFYERLNGILDGAGFDAFAESECARFYAPRMGRPGLQPGRYFRLLFLGYFEGLDSERAIAWRAQDSLSIRRFLGLGLSESSPDHSTVSRTRRLIDVETHRRVFGWVLGRLSEAGLVSGKTLGVDATTLEANAALRSIVRRETGEDYEEFLRGLAEASGLETPTRAELASFDRKRKKKMSNEEWVNPHDEEAEITKMKDGRTHLAHKAEQAVDLESGVIVGVTIQGGSKGDTKTLLDTLEEAFEQVESATGGEAAIEELVADKGYHSNEVLADINELGMRSYISEPDRGRRRWKGKHDLRDIVYANRRRIRGNRGKRLLRQRGERLERPFAHLFETGGMRRLQLRGRSNILKRVLVHAGGCNLGMLMRELVGIGTPKSLQGRAAAACIYLVGSFFRLCRLIASGPAIFAPRDRFVPVDPSASPLTDSNLPSANNPDLAPRPNCWHFCHGLLRSVLDLHHRSVILLGGLDLVLRLVHSRPH